jgi:hypothetical protein
MEVRKSTRDETSCPSVGKIEDHYPSLVTRNGNVTSINFLWS